jgi:hypothetical protein
MVRDVYTALQDKTIAATPTNTNTSNTSSSSSASAGNGTKLLTKALPLLLREHEYWTTGPKAVMVQGPDGSMHNLSRCDTGLVWHTGVREASCSCSWY